MRLKGRFHRVSALLTEDDRVLGGIFHGASGRGLVVSAVFSSPARLHRVLLALRDRKPLSGKKNEFSSPFSIVGRTWPSRHCLSRTVAITLVFCKVQKFDVRRVDAGRTV
jgi:hypothetical protein